MRNLFRKLISRPSVEEISGKNANMSNKAKDLTTSEADLEHMKLFLGSKQAMIDMPASLVQTGNLYQLSGVHVNPLEMFLVVNPEPGDSYEEIVVFQTSLQEVLSPYIKLCKLLPERDRGMEVFTDALRDFADEIDKILSRKAKRSENNALKLE
jgi:hypothetical protein